MPIRPAIVAVLLAAGGLAVAARGPDLDVGIAPAAGGTWSTFDAFVDDLAAADVVFLGERHDHAPTHVFETSVLEALAARRGDVILALEMFDRDVQASLEHFLMGHVDEAEFLADADPWPNYTRDYKPLVDLAVDRAWPVVAANAARVVVDAVLADGLAALAARPAAERTLAAQDVTCPTDDAYAMRFRDAMRSHDTAVLPAGGTASLDHFHAAQCLKDETMAESIARAHAIGSMGDSRALVVSVNGSFHSDYGDGLVARTRRRLPEGRIVNVSIVPMRRGATLPDTPPADTRADYVVYVPDDPRP